jgi:hypothetical protein
MDTIQNVAKETIAFEKRYMVNMEAIALLTMAQDLSNTIKHISEIIQLTVGKYAQILTHAAMGTTHLMLYHSQKLKDFQEHSTCKKDYTCKQI